MASGLYFTVVLCLTSGLWAEEIGGAKPSNECCADKCCKRCPEGWTWFDDYCYKFYFNEKDWADAEVACIDVGGNLASIHTKDHYDFVKGLIQTSAGTDKPTWVGGTDAVKEGVWLWSDGSTFDFTFLESKQPFHARRRELCMELSDNGDTGDIPCTELNSYVCGRSL